MTTPGISVVPAGCAAPPVALAQLLPPEIVARIAFWADPRTPSTFKNSKVKPFIPKKKHLCLRSASLTCRSWREPFQRQLCYSVALSGDDSLLRHRLPKFLKSSLPKRYPILHLCLILTDTRHASHVCRSTLKGRRVIKSLEIRAARWTIDANTAESLQLLEELRLDGLESSLVRIDSTAPSQALALPSLRKLVTDIDPFAAFTLSHLLELPSLKELEIQQDFRLCRQWTRDPPDFHHTLPLLGKHAPKLARLCLSITPYPSGDSLRLMGMLSRHLSTCTSLCVFHIMVSCSAQPDDVPIIARAISSIPRTAPLHELLISLQLVSRTALQELICMTTRLIISGRLQHLQVFHVHMLIKFAEPPSPTGRHEMRSILLGPQWDALRSACRNQGIKLDLRLHLG